MSQQPEEYTSKELERKQKAREYTARWRAKRTDETRAREREANREAAARYRARHPERVNEARRKWAREKPEAVREAARKARAKHPIKVRARLRVQSALESGRLTKQPCQVCGATNVHGHHTDYGRPLDVQWLCPKHHRDAHRNFHPIVPETPPRLKAVLTAAQIREIHMRIHRGEKGVNLAHEFGVHESVVSRIKSGVRPGLSEVLAEAA